MNQSSSFHKVQSYRYQKKRNSHDIVRSTHSSKNSKKPLPQVIIDLHQKTKKLNNFTHNTNNKLTINHHSYHNTNNINKNAHINSNYYKQKQSKKLQIQNPHHQHQNLNSTLNKSKISQHPIHFIQNNTQPLRKQQDMNSISISHYREDISQLRMENQCLRQENLSLRKNQEYLIEELRQIKIIRRQEKLKRDEDKEFIQELKKKIREYGDQIESLYVQLIEQKQKNSYFSSNSHIKIEGHKNISKNSLKFQLPIQQIQSFSQKSQHENKHNFSININNSNLNLHKISSPKQKYSKFTKNSNDIQQFPTPYSSSARGENENKNRNIKKLNISCLEEVSPEEASPDAEADDHIRQNLQEIYKKKLSDPTIMNKKSPTLYNQNYNYNCNYNKQNDHSSSNSNSNYFYLINYHKPSPSKYENHKHLQKPSNSDFKLINNFYRSLQRQGRQAYDKQRAEQNQHHPHYRI